MSGDGETSEEQLGSWGAIRTLVWDRSHVQVFRTSNWQLAFGIWRLAERLWPQILTLESSSHEAR